MVDVSVWDGSCECYGMAVVSVMGYVVVSVMGR